MICAVTGCAALARSRGLCNRHYKKLQLYGRPDAGRTAARPYRRRGTGTLTPTGYIFVGKGKVARGEHVLVAERALGKPLPRGARVHHVNEVRSDNRPDNLVVCPNEAYHRLLHRRMDAFEACGHYDWRRCNICKEYDAPDRLFINAKGTEAYHRACSNEYLRAYRATPEGSRRLVESQP